MLKEHVRGMSSVVFGIVIVLCIFIIPVLFIKGGDWLSREVLHLLNLLSLTTLTAFIVVLLPLSMYSKTRSVSGSIMVLASFIFGVNLWLYGLLLTYWFWGEIVVCIGLIAMGIGVVPIAMLAAPLKGMWLEFGVLLLLIILTFGVRGFGYYLVEKSLYKPRH